MKYIKTTYDIENNCFLSNKKVSTIRKSTFEREIKTGEYLEEQFKYRENFVKTTKRKRIELAAI